MTTQIWESALPTVSYENMNGRALLEESYRAELRTKGGINFIFHMGYLGNLRWIIFPWCALNIFLISTYSDKMQCFIMQELNGA